MVWDWSLGVWSKTCSYSEVCILVLSDVWDLNLGSPTEAIKNESVRKKTFSTDPGLYKFTLCTKCKRTKNANETNERFTRTIRKTHDTRNERTIHERTNEMKRMNARYMKRTNARYTNERIIGA